jgi:dynein heavy chain 1
MRTLLERCKEWLALLPHKFATLPPQPAESQDPLYRLFAREGSIGRKLLDQVRKDLADVVKVCQGELKQTNHLRILLNDLPKGTIPNHWRRYKVSKSVGVSGWVANFAKRLEQLDTIAQLDSLSNIEVWLGGLFFPEAFITATRQAVAHRKKWSLETLNLCLDIERVNDPSAFIVDGTALFRSSPPPMNPRFDILIPFIFVGLALEGASWATDQLVLNDGETVRLNPSQIRWVQTDESAKEGVVNLPVYLNGDRSDVLFTVNLPFDCNAGLLVAMRAVCLTAGG